MASVSIVFPDRPGDVRSLLGVTEDLSLAVPATVRRTRSGAPRVDGPVYGQKWSVRLSGSGDRQQLPELSDLRIGDPIRIASSCWWTHPVLGAAADVPRIGKYALPRPIALRTDGRFAAELRGFDGRAWYRNADNDWSAYQLALRIASFEGQILDRLVLWYRPLLSCVITGLSASGTSSARDQGWSLDAEEEYPS